MSTYVTEEEQIEAIKRWWNKYGNLLSTIALVVLLIFYGYRWYQGHLQSVAINASRAYEQLMHYAAEDDSVALTAQANYIKTNYPNSIYATGASLLLARESVSHHKLQEAKTHLEWVTKHSSAATLITLANIRLARIELEEKNYTNALTILSKIKNPSFNVVVLELKGDIYRAKGDIQQAKLRYRKALEALPNSFKNKVSLLSMKLNQLSQVDTLGLPKKMVHASA